VGTLLKVTCLAVVVPRRALAGIETSRSEAMKIKISIRTIIRTQTFMH